MRFLKVLVIAMGVLIVVATTVLVVLIAHRLGGSSAPATVAAASALLDQPPGTRIVGVVAVNDRLALQLQGGGPDRVILLDPRTGAVIGTVGLRGQ